MTRNDVDVLVIGAGLSGIDAGCRLASEAPGKTFAILEARGDLGGTWDLFRYPGIRSDSDMTTLGFPFRPWGSDVHIADGADIREYIRDTAHEYGVDRRIRYHRRALRAEWSEADARWTVEVEHTDTGETSTMTAGFVYAATGYYHYDEPFTPDFPGIERFRGDVVHPQHWSEDVDYAGKRVVVIGSGATAITLIPSLTPKAAHVTMLQRSPGYVIPQPKRDKIAKVLYRVLPDRRANSIVRWKNIVLTLGFFHTSRRAPGVVRRIIRGVNKALLPKGFDVDTHFKPRYDPWDERVCVVPDGDLFKAIRRGDADIVTDHIDTFTETGIRLRSGRELEADLVVTATGLNLLALGGVEIVVDGERVDPGRRVTYKGMMLAGVPNAALALGYTNASWTLKCDLVAQYICRLLNHMDERGYVAMRPDPPADIEPVDPFVDLESNYIKRSVEKLPKQGQRQPWRVHQNYFTDIVALGRADLEEGMAITRAPARDAVAA